MYTTAPVFITAPAGGEDITADTGPRITDRHQHTGLRQTARHQTDRRAVVVVGRLNYLLKEGDRELKAKSFQQF